MANQEGSHVRESFPADCIGERCPNFSGDACTDSAFNWVSAKATVSEGRDTGRPPLVDEAIFVTYGQVCLRGAKPKSVGYRIDDYGNGDYAHEETGLLVHGDSRFGSGIDVDMYKIGVDEDGSVEETLQHTYDGWG